MVDTSVDDKVQRLQAMLYAKACNERSTRFKHLYKYLVRKHWVETAVQRVLRSRGSRTPGVDGITRGHLQGEEREHLVEEIIEVLRAQTYQPKPVRRVYIPKANGKKRPLGIPTLKDRIVQEMVRMLIEPIFEAHFLPCSYGFRPHRCTWDALAEVYHYTRAPCLYHTIIEGDIQDCFGTIHHARLVREVHRFILDKRLLALLWRMLKAGAMENLRYFETNEGSPQGGIVSPVLANAYMHALDEWFHLRFHVLNKNERAKLHRRGELAYVRYIRFADDFVILMRSTEQQAWKLKQEVSHFVNEELMMTLSEEKTLITQITDGFDFLGVRTFVAPSRKNPNHKLPYQVPAAKSIRSYRNKVRELTHRRYDYLTLAERMRAINWLVSGWANYHRWGNAKDTFGTLGWWTARKVHKMLRRNLPDIGERAFYRKCYRPIADCANLTRWGQSSSGQTLVVDVENGYRLGLVPMGLFSTASYWKFRGAKIPSAFPLLEETEKGTQRTTSFCTADEVIIQTQPNLWEVEEYTTLYFLRRKEAFRRDNYQCTECDYQSKRQWDEVHDLECHHIIPRGGHDMDNLKTVCIPCHRRLTANAGLPD